MEKWEKMREKFSARAEQSLSLTRKKNAANEKKKNKAVGAFILTIKAQVFKLNLMQTNNALT